MKSLFVLLSILSCTLLLSAQEIPLRIAHNIIWNAKHVQTADNSILIAWQDTNDADEDIYIHKLDSNGSLLWTNPLRITETAYMQYVMDFVATSDGNFIIVWHSKCANGSISIKAQKISSAGDLLWQEPGIDIVTGLQYYTQSRAVANSLGGIFLLYETPIAQLSILGQNVDGNANLLWENGRVMHSDSYKLVLDDVFSDNEGGMMVNLRRYSNFIYPVSHLLHLSPSGTVIGANPLIAESPFSSDHFRILPSGADNFVLYSCEAYGQCNLKLQKMDMQGNLLLTDPTIYALGYYQDMESLIPAISPNGDLFVSWTSKINSNLNSLRFLRFDASLNPYWLGGGLQVFTDSEESYGHAMQIASNGSIWIVWNSMVQKLGTIGNTLFVYPVLLCEQEQEMPLIFSSGEEALFVWKAVITTRQSLRRQQVDAYGGLHCEVSGTTIVQEYNGSGKYSHTFRIQDSFISVWADNRNPESLQKLYYQIYSPTSGSVLETDGRALNPDQNLVEYYQDATILPDNNLAIIYSAYQNGSHHFYLQKIDQNGNRLYAGFGILCTFGFSNQSSFRISYHNGDIYVGWRRFSVESGSQIVGQRISNDQIQWEPEGKIILQVPENHTGYFEALLHNYYVWTIRDNSYTEESTRVLRVNEDGNPALDWDPEGMKVLAESISGGQSLAQAGMMGEDLGFIIRVEHSSLEKYFAQRINLAGERLWQDNGIDLMPLADESIFKNAQISNGMSILFQNASDMSQIRMQIINPEGSLLLGEEGNLIVETENSYFQSNLIKYANASYTCFVTVNQSGYTQGEDLYYVHISPSGEPYTETLELLCDAPFAQSAISAAVLGNRAFVTWNDNRSNIFGNSLDFPSIYGTMIESMPVTVEDAYLDSPQLPRLFQNYPNPFNPITTIRYELATPSFVTLKIYNLKGQLIKNLLDGFTPAGINQVIWDGKDQNANAVSSGIYLYRLQSATGTCTAKMLLLK